jgi:hypothetical protein
MPIPEHLSDIVRRVNDYSALRRIPWKEGAEAGEFYFALEGYSIVVSHVTRGIGSSEMAEQNAPIQWRVVDAQGSDQDSFVVEPGDADYAIVASTYVNARRTARNMDKMVRDITAQLAQYGPPPLAITRAVYGVIADTSKSKDVTREVTAYVADNTLRMQPSDYDAKFGDPAQGERKHLQIEYTLGGVRKVKTVFQLDPVRLPEAQDEP